MKTVKFKWWIGKFWYIEYIVLCAVQYDIKNIQDNIAVYANFVYRIFCIIKSNICNL